MCVMNIFTKHKEKKQERALQQQIMQQVQEQKRQELLMRQQEDVATRNYMDNENKPLKENETNNTKRRISNLRIPLLRLQGTGANLGEDVGYGLNLGGAV